MAMPLLHPCACCLPPLLWLVISLGTHLGVHLIKPGMCTCSTCYNSGRCLYGRIKPWRSAVRLLFVFLQQHLPGLAVVSLCWLAWQSHGCHLETGPLLPVHCLKACACHCCGREICQVHVASPSAWAKICSGSL
jgi:hypothetical protein